ncbi:hypothetical protein ACFO4N_02145 [Camelliibacillus cellulosilyticus]|uniref:Uncharacterized protein n=1 Tax=Camelliibacillus cellulosilyticus TaxID=2174486 RepID=A0ABV9GHB3_9BACL
MSVDHFYHQCRQHIERPVEITCKDGAVHRGLIHSVDRTHVYLRPFNIPDGPQGPGMFAWGFPGAFAGGFLGGLTGVALGNIAFFRPFPYFY